MERIIESQVSNETETAEPSSFEGLQGFESVVSAVEDLGALLQYRMKMNEVITERAAKEKFCIPSSSLQTRPIARSMNAAASAGRAEDGY